ncbi:MAG TPA: hypothetical protein VIF62_26085 [Labilithrix sp.]
MVCVFPYLRGVNNPNEFVRVFTAMSIVEHGTFRIDEQVQLYGWVNDMAHREGHYYMVKAPGSTYLGIPGYAIFAKIVAPLLRKQYPTAATPMDQKLWWLRMSTWALRLFGSNLPCFLFLLWFERYLRDFSRDPLFRYAAVAAAGLGTNYLAYTHMFASHAQYAAIAFLAFAMSERERRFSGGDASRARISKALLAGFFTSACVMFEYHALFLAIILTLFGLRTFSPLGRGVQPIVNGLVTAAIGAAIGAWSWVKHVDHKHWIYWVSAAIVLAGVANVARGVLRGGLRDRPLVVWRALPRFAMFCLGGLVNVPLVMFFHWRAYGNPLTPGHQMLETQRFAIEHSTGLWGVVWPTWDHVKALAADPGFGFFGMSPFMWLGAVGVPILLIAPFGPPTTRRTIRTATFVWALSGLTLFLVNAGIIEWRAGWTVGPRYLAACPPFFAFGAVLFLERASGTSRVRRAIARGVAGGLALASVLAIGTVSLVYDTLPESITRPFAEFAIPMMWTGFVPHHILEWFGVDSYWPWYVACAAMLAAPMLAGLWPAPETRLRWGLRAFAFVLACGVGIAPALMPTEDGTKLFVLHPETRAFIGLWEPPGRDRITLMRNDAERYGPRAPCKWHRLAILDRALGNESQARQDEARAKGVPRDRCARVMF